MTHVRKAFRSVGKRQSLSSMDGTVTMAEVCATSSNEMVSPTTFAAYKVLPILLIRFRIHSGHRRFSDGAYDDAHDDHQA